MENIFDKLSTHSKNVLKNALSFALSYGQKMVTPTHVLYSLALERGSIANQILNKAKMDGFALKKRMIETQPPKASVTRVELAPATRKLIEKSFIIANVNKHRYIGTEHLLASVLDLHDPQLQKFFEHGQIDVNDMQRQVSTILNSTSRFPEITEPKDEEPFDDHEGGAALRVATLESFATNLTNPDIQKHIDPVIGRFDEIERLIQILSRRTKNNPMLLGDPGVGKTAIVEGLAKKIVTGEVPQVLADKKIFALDLSLVVAGTSFRGEFENRLKQIIAEVKKDPRIILFIDEVHNIIGVGSATGSMDAANILKPALARGEIRCIGATTTEEFKKHIENDPALERRFQPIFVTQPTIEKTIEILNGIRVNYEEYHGVTITESAIKSAAKLSERYITDRFLPDKAIDLIDEAASAAKVRRLSERATRKIWELEHELQKVKDKKEYAVAQQRFDSALRLQDQEQELKTHVAQVKRKRSNRLKKPLAAITENDIAAVVSKITGVPLAELVVQEKNQLLKLERLLAKRVVGQDTALRFVAESIRRSRTGIADAKRPIGSFIFLGPSGVGKTELARQLAETVFGTSEALVKIDMSEFSESFNISKLIGAPAGYVGYKEGAKLTDAVRHRPYSVVLFDEIEKAHYHVFNLLLQVLDEGYITDGTGKQINFKNTIVIMTSNLGSDHFNRQAAIGFQATDPDKQRLMGGMLEIEHDVLEELKRRFPPEFLSRIDKTVVFQPLHQSTLLKIVRIHLKDLQQRLQRQSVTFSYTPSVARYIAEKSFSPGVGAREIRKTIQDEIETAIARKLLKNVARPQRNISATVKRNKLIV